MELAYHYGIDTFFKTDVRDNAATGNREWWATCDIDELSPLSLLIGDAVHNFRSTLDHLFYQLVIANQQVPDRSTHFPVKKDRASYIKSGATLERQIGVAAKCQLDELKPYAGGNDELWVLHQLDITDKHKLLVPFATSYRGTITTVAMADFTKPTADAPFSRGTMKTVMPSEPVPVNKTPTLLFEMGLTDSDIEQIEPHFTLVLEEPGVTTHGSLVVTLEKIGELTKGVLDAFARYIQ